MDVDEAGQHSFAVEVHDLGTRGGTPGEFRIAAERQNSSVSNGHGTRNPVAGFHGNNVGVLHQKVCICAGRGHRGERD
jgi:hypothetical protein